MSQLPIPIEITSSYGLYEKFETPKPRVINTKNLMNFKAYSKFINNLVESASQIKKDDVADCHHRLRDSRHISVYDNATEAN